MKISDMSVEQLEALSTTLKGQIGELQAQRIEIQEALSHRIAKERAQSMVEGMSSDERAALAQALGVDGISSGENVGVPGR